MGKTARSRALWLEADAHRCLRRERVQGKDTRKCREANRRRQLQTAIHCRRHAKPPPSFIPGRVWLLVFLLTFSSQMVSDCEGVTEVACSIVPHKGGAYL